MPTITPVDSKFIMFPVPERIWSTNDERKMHHMKVASYVEAWRTAAFWGYKKAWKSEPMPYPALVELQLPVPDKRRRDPMNYCGTVLKAVIDGMVHAGAWPDDTPEYVRHLEPQLTDKENVYVFVTPRIDRG